MLSVRKRISIDSFMRIILICALIAVPMSMVFFSQLKAETFENALVKQPHVVNPRQDCKKPGDADDIGGKKDYQFQQDYNGDGDFSRSSRGLINPGTNANENKHLFFYLIFYRLMMERGLILLSL